MKSFKTLIISLFLLCFNLSSLHSHVIEKVVIIGSGAVGASAAIFTGQAKLTPLVIQDNDCKAQMALIHSIDNYPGVLEDIEGVELLNKFRQQAQNFGARFVDGSVEAVDLLNKPFRIDLANGEQIYTETLIIASGTEKRWLGIPNEQALRGKGVVSATFCKDSDFTHKNVVVVGGGHAALQEALFIANVADKVTIVNRSNVFNASKFHQEQVFNNSKISVLYNTEVDDILDPRKNKVTSVILRDKINNQITTLPADYVLIAIGSQPNSKLFKGQLELTDSGHIVVNGKNTSTNIPGVFAAGDVTEVAYGRVVIAAGAGAMSAMDAIRYLDR